MTEYYDWNSEPLHLAIRNGHIECIKILLGAGVDINEPGEGFCNDSPLVRAVTAEQLEVVKLLLARGANPDLETSWEEEPEAKLNVFDWAVRFGFDDILKTLLDAHPAAIRDHRFRQMLEVAAENHECIDHSDGIEMLLRLRATSQGRDPNRETILHGAAGDGFLFIMPSIHDEFEIDMHSRDSEGHTSLWLAMREYFADESEERRNIIYLLLEYGATFAMSLMHEDYNDLNCTSDQWHDMLDEGPCLFKLQDG